MLFRRKITRSFIVASQKRSAQLTFHAIASRLSDFHRILYPETMERDERRCSQLRKVRAVRLREINTRARNSRRILASAR